MYRRLSQYYSEYRREVHDMSVKSHLVKKLWSERQHEEKRVNDKSSEGIQLSKEVLTLQSRVCTHLHRLNINSR